MVDISDILRVELLYQTRQRGLTGSLFNTVMQLLPKIPISKNMPIKYKLDGIYNTLMETYSDTPFMSALIAGSLATIGLAINSTSTVVASTLISPIGTFIIQANLLQFLKTFW